MAKIIYRAQNASAGRAHNLAEILAIAAKRDPVWRMLPASSLRDRFGAIRPTLCRRGLRRWFARG